jgi:hypothetical protein
LNGTGFADNSAEATPMGVEASKEIAGRCLEKYSIRRNKYESF